jgi:predicted PurR-regulated permease PerM
MWRLQFMFIILFVSFTITLILLPLVRKLHTYHIPAVFAVFIPLGLLIGSLIVVTSFMLPVIASQFEGLATDLPGLVDRLPIIEADDRTVQTIRDFISTRVDSIGSTVVQTGTTLAKIIFGLLTVLVLVMYWLSSYDSVKKTLVSFLPTGQRKAAKNIWGKIEVKLGRWFIGQTLVSLAVGFMVWVAATLLGLPYAGVLAFAAALFEIIPTVGPIAAAIPAVLIGASESIEKAVIVTVVYIVIQQVESHVLSPIIMGKTVRLHPMVIIVSLLFAGSLFGLVGAFFAVPAALFVSAFVDYFRPVKMQSKQKE